MQCYATYLNSNLASYLAPDNSALSCILTEGHPAKANGSRRLCQPRRLLASQTAAPVEQAEPCPTSPSPPISSAMSARRRLPQARRNDEAGLRGPLLLLALLASWHVAPGFVPWRKVDANRPASYGGGAHWAVSAAIGAMIIKALDYREGGRSAWRAVVALPRRMRAEGGALTATR